jgi:hypothetical protein
LGLSDERSKTMHEEQFALLMDALREIAEALEEIGEAIKEVR